MCVTTKNIKTNFKTAHKSSRFRNVIEKWVFLKTFLITSFLFSKIFLEKFYCCDSKIGKMMKGWNCFVFMGTRWKDISASVSRVFTQLPPGPHKNRCSLYVFPPASLNTVSFSLLLNEFYLVSSRLYSLVCNCLLLLACLWHSLLN